VEKKRCFVEREGLKMRLTVKDDVDIEGTQAMEKKGSVKDMEKVSVAPNWDAAKMESSASVIEMSKELIQQTRASLSKSTKERKTVKEKLCRTRILISNQQAMHDDIVTSRNEYMVESFSFENPCHEH
jgi:hypothetical protein